MENNTTTRINNIKRSILLLLFVFILVGGFTIKVGKTEASVIAGQITSNEVTDYFGPYFGGPNHLPIQYLGSGNGAIVESLIFKIQKNSGANGHIYASIQNYPLGGTGCTGTGYLTFEGEDITDTSIHTIVLNTASSTAGNTLVNQELDADCQYRIIWYSYGNSFRLYGNSTSDAYAGGYLTCDTGDSCNPTVDLNGIYDAYFQLLDDGGPEQQGEDSTATRFITVTPTNNTSVNTGTPPFDGTETATVVAEAEIYFNSITDPSTIITQTCMSVERIDTEVGFTYVPICQDIIASGQSTHEYTWVNLPAGMYSAIYWFANEDNTIKVHALGTTFINIYTLVPNQSCLYGVNVQTGACEGSFIPSGFGSDTQTATTTTDYSIPLEDCDQFTTLSAERIGCAITNAFIGTVNVLFIPNTYSVNLFITNLKTNILTKFPIGYITDFVSIMSTSTVGTLTAMEGTVPNGIPGAGYHFSVTLDNVLDPLLNATTSTFITATEDDTGTFYEITSYYWNIIVGIMFVLYLASRILGSSFNISFAGKNSMDMGYIDDGEIKFNRFGKGRGGSASEYLKSKRK